MSSSIDVLDAVRRLLEEPQFQDVHFVCSDGRTVSSNRSFLAARCEYFERLLFGNLKESSCSEIQLHASSEAVRHVLVHLHTGGFTSIEQEACWITLMEASSLAQQYILPGMVQHVADRLSADLSPQNLGLALSHALKADLQAVIKSIWVALPRLLQQPFTLDRSFSADAICFCLQHTAWMSHPAMGGSPSPTAASTMLNSPHLSSSNNTSAGTNPPVASEASGTAVNINRTSSINGASLGSSSVGLPQGGDGAAILSRALVAAGSRAESSMAQEAQAFSAVLDWMLQEVSGCADCHASRSSTASCRGDDNSASHGCGGSRATTPQAAAAAAPAHFAHQVQSSMQRQVAAAAAATPAAGIVAAGSSRAGGLDRSFSLSPSLGEGVQPMHPAMQGSRLNVQQTQALGGQLSQGTVAGRLSSHSVRSSYESDTTEGEADIRSMRSGTLGAFSAAAGGAAAMPAVSAFAASSASCSSRAADTQAPATSAGSSTSSLAAPAAAAGRDSTEQVAAAAAGVSCLTTLCPVEKQLESPAQPEQDKEQQQELVYSGCCCEGHQGMLLQMLAHLNWHLLEPRLLDSLDSLALLGPAALLEIYRAQQRCCHMAQWGNFPSLALGGERGLRCYITGGEQVLECESVSHLTATSNLCFTRGRHCWQFVVTVPCDLVWLGLSDGSLQPDVWGGKQPGGWFYGSNDALCHNKQSDRHAYTKHCGNGKWGDGAVVDVYLDMDAREVWFGVDGAEPKLGFTGLPDRVYPAVSLRAPAQLLVRFRAASWLMMNDTTCTN